MAGLAYGAIFRAVVLDRASGRNATKVAAAPRISLAEWDALAHAACTTDQLAVMLASDHTALHALRMRLRISGFAGD
jgi:hypothetical protein